MKTSSKFRIVTFVVLSFLILTMAACEKYVTPNKVERKLKDESWDIANFHFIDENITSMFTGEIFSFEEDGSIVITGNWSISGTWSLGLNDDPTVIYIGGFSQEPYSFMNDDWIVETISDDKMTLKDDTGMNELVFVLHED